MKILIIDSGDVVFNGNSLNVKGLGGSEAAIILIAKELYKIGFNVTVFNNCIDEDCVSGIFDNILYIDKSELHNLSDDYDIIISSRSVLPFLPDNQLYNILNKNSYKIVWLHDTFCRGDEYLEYALVNNYFNEIFTLSDFHTNYILNADHDNKRMYENFKNKIFQTRNGAIKHKNIDIHNKNKNDFVYNASISKGLIPLLEYIWPEIKKNIPLAKLYVIGGYYNLKNNIDNDQKDIFDQLIKYNKDPSVIFLGIVTNREAVRIVARSRFMIYPTSLPETFGISALESLLYKTPIITCRFGALEETALEKACYLLDYPIEPNSLFPNINKEHQTKKFIDLVMRAYNDEYLYNQKQEYGSIVETDDIYSWASIALQWKQQLYYKIGHFLSKEEYKNVTKINNSVARIFGRRFRNLVESDHYPNYNKSEKPIKIITPVFNAESYIERCIISVLTQDYENYIHYIIDDNSTDNTLEIIEKYIDNGKIVLIQNDTNNGALFNQYHTITELCGNDDIIILLDGDDCLMNNNTIFNYYNDIHDTYDFTYGSCWSEVDNIPLIAQEYPDEVKLNKSYKEYRFDWNIPYTHLRTFKKHLINDVDINNFKKNDEWLKAGGDVALFYELINNVDNNKIKAVKELVALYNDKNPINDYKVNLEEHLDNVATVFNIPPVLDSFTNNDNKISIIIPTMWKYHNFINTLKQLVTVNVVGEIIIINNDITNTPEDSILEHAKIKLHNFPENTYVNPAWNFGVKHSIYSKLCIMNDDIEYDIKLFNKVINYITPDNGAAFINIRNKFNNKDIKIVRNNDDQYFGFGVLFFIHKDNWIDIPKELLVYYGDTFILDSLLMREKPIYNIIDIDFYTETGTTSTLTPINVEPIEGKYYHEKIFPELNAAMVVELNYNWDMIGKPFINYLNKMNNELECKPKVIYDIGANLLHWHREAIKVWPTSKYYLFDAVELTEPYLQKSGDEYHIGVLSDSDGRLVNFYEKFNNIGGSSYYKENRDCFTEEDIVVKSTRTLDSIIEEKGWLLPDLMKLDVQGAELDILRGAAKCIDNCKDIILEAQHENYNEGAPKLPEVLEYMNSIGFALIAHIDTNGPDGNYHFKNRKFIKEKVMSFDSDEFNNLMNPNKDKQIIDNNKLEIFFHVYVPDYVNIQSLWWIDEELSAIDLSNLKENANINLCITINKTFAVPLPPKIVLTSIIDYIKTKYNYANVLDIRDTSEENIYEQQTLNYVYDFSINNPNKKVLYIHTKGISVFSETQKEWLSILNKSLIHDWKNCIEHLETNDVVGLKDSSPINNQIIVSGNFFWANTNYIATLPNPKDTYKYSNYNNRYDYELWITSKKPKIYFTYNTKTNHYLEIFQEKTILIAIPTDKYILPETFKSIYDLIIPNGYKTHFQFFYGYRVDQIRNLIAHWAKNYDYLFAVDSDISFPADTLMKLLNANKDIVTGLYVQRNETENNLEIYNGLERLLYNDIKDKGLIEINRCGFGCVLVDSKVINTMEYPHFEYRPALNHGEAYSEDIYFCDKAVELGFKIFADTSILCSHHGKHNFTVK